MRENISEGLPSDMLFSTCKKHMRRLLISACSSLSHRRMELPRGEAAWFCRTHTDTHRHTKTHALLQQEVHFPLKSRQQVSVDALLTAFDLNEKVKHLQRHLQSLMPAAGRCGITVAAVDPCKTLNGRWEKKTQFFPRLGRTVLQRHQGSRPTALPAARFHREAGAPWLNGKGDVTAWNRHLKTLKGQFLKKNKKGQSVALIAVLVSLLQLHTSDAADGTRHAEVWPVLKAFVQIKNSLNI